MKIRPMKRAAAMTLLSALTVVTVDGCTAAKMMSAPQATGAEAAPKKEYNWQDMSTGRSFYGKPKPTPPAN